LLYARRTTEAWCAFIPRGASHATRRGGRCRVAQRIERLLERRGLAGDTEGGCAPDGWSEEAPALAAVAAASVQGLVALGARAGARVRRSGNPPEEVEPLTPRPCHAHVRGFDLHAGTSLERASVSAWSACVGTRCGYWSPGTGCT